MKGLATTLQIAAGAVGVGAFIWFLLQPRIIEELDIMPRAEISERFDQLAGNIGDLGVAVSELTRADREVVARLARDLPQRVVIFNEAITRIEEGSCRIGDWCPAIVATSKTMEGIEAGCQPLYPPLGEVIVQASGARFAAAVHLESLQRVAETYEISDTRELVFTVWFRVPPEVQAPVGPALLFIVSGYTSPPCWVAEEAGPENGIPFELLPEG